MAEPGARVALDYGTGKLFVRLPAGCTAVVIERPPMPLLDDPAGAVVRALEAPSGAPPLSALAGGRKSVCIAICDATRPVPNHELLPPLVRALVHAGIAPGRITVLVATGLHAPGGEAEMAALVGDPWVAATVRTAYHDARRDADHACLGPAPGGTPVALDRRFIDADLRIVVGLVEPHFMAGYSGGRKVIAPGLAHERTIRSLHAARFMEHPAARSGVLGGNPLHEELVAIARMAGPVYAVNTVIDRERRMAFVNFGDVVDSHLAAVAFARPSAEVPVGRRFATVLASAAGDPLDRTYYQTVKGMVAAIDILAPGGDIFVVSACREGLGSAEFAAAQRALVALGPERFVAALRDKPLADIDAWQTEYQAKPMRAGRVHLFTEGLSVEERLLTGVRVIDALEAEIAASIARHRVAEVAVLPEGPYVVATPGPS